MLSPFFGHYFAIGIFAEALAAAMNASCAGINQAAIYVERQVVDWFKTIAGFPTPGMGLLVSGGSMATLTALAVARHAQLKKAGVDVRAAGLQGSGSTCVVYTSAEGHSCIRKAVELLGIGSDNLRLVPVDERRRMRPGALTELIERDLQAGHRPIAVAASAGTVNAGAIDPIKEIHEVCDRFGLWLHIDGAYGAAAILTRRYHAELEAMQLGDSLALDPHKWLYVPVEAGLVLVRDADLMRDAFSLVPSYLRTVGNPQGVTGPPWLAEYGFQQTRGFRALKVWMAIKHHGINGYAEAIERDCALAEYLARQVSAHPDLELVASGLSIVCFRYVPSGARAGNDQHNAWNKAVLEELQLGGKVFVSSTELDGKFVLRACIVNHRTEQSGLDLLVSLVAEAGERLRQQTEGQIR